MLSMTSSTDIRRAAGFLTRRNLHSVVRAGVSAIVLLALWTPSQLSPVFADSAVSTPIVGVGSQYDDSHVYVHPGQLSNFVASFVATFGGSSTKQLVMTITPTPSKTRWEGATSPEGSVSAFDFMTPIPYYFGTERVGYLVTDMDAAVQAAKANGADIVVAPFNDAIGRDAIIEWPGGVFMQLYWHKVQAHNPPFATVPENRVYVSPDKADEFITDFVNFSHGSVVSDEATAPGVEIGSPGITYRRVRIDSIFGKITVFVTNGQLPYPFGYETTGYEVTNLKDTLAKAKNSGAVVLAGPTLSEGIDSAIVRFPGGYIAEIHSTGS